ncbi:unnamed protein product [Trichogramma brassicae]|uniref:RNase H type-1 domain-containing protein n=1 Tax=Trichogramma brassicae TaxID=86971 RepID=A0A6H5IAR7_9HYME|nr:unnamed protein product [Trichogramma brassicae]
MFRARAARASSKSTRIQKKSTWISRKSVVIAFFSAHDRSTRNPCMTHVESLYDPRGIPTKRLLRPRRGSAMPCRCLLVDVGEVRSESTGIGSTPLLARRPSLVDGWWIGAGFRSPRLLLDDLRIGAASRSPTYLARWLVGRRRVSMVNLTKIPGAPGVGYAFYCPEDDHHFSRALIPLASIFSAECHAINNALDYITHLADDRKYIIMSDSLSALMSLQSLNISVKTNHVILDIKERLSTLSHGSVSLAWIPSHIGIGGNETVDALARAATESPPAGSPTANFTDLAESFRRDCFTTSNAKCEGDGLHKDIIYFDLFHRDEKSTP